MMTNDKKETRELTSTEILMEEARAAEKEMEALEDRDARNTRLCYERSMQQFYEYEGLDADQEEYVNDMTGFIETPMIDQTVDDNQFKDTVTMEISKIMDEISANSFVEKDTEIVENDKLNVNDNNAAVPYLDNEDEKDSKRDKKTSEKRKTYKGK